jgi:hypothetical protein
MAELSSLQTKSRALFLLDHFNLVKGVKDTIAQLKLLSFLAIVILSSCRKDDEFEIRIVNHTNYEIDVFELRDYDHKYKYSIGAMDSIEIEAVDLVTKCICPMTGRYLSLGIEEFSDSTGNFEHSRGFTGQNSLNQTRLNIIDVKLADNPEFPDYVFETWTRE